MPDARSSIMGLDDPTTRISRPCPLPRRLQPRIQIQARRAGRSTAADTRSSARSEIESTSTRPSSRTVTTRCAARSAFAAPARAAGARCRSSRSATTAAAGSFTVDRPGRWPFAVTAWTDRIATWQDELRRKVGGGAGGSAQRARRGRGAARRRRADRRGGACRHGVRPARQGRLAAFARVDVDRELARFGSWYELFPRSWGGFRGVAEALPELARARLRRRLPAADPPDRARRAARAATTRPSPSRATSARRGRSARPRAATTRSTPTSARWADFDAHGRRGAAARRRARARLRDPVLARPSLVDGASGVVQPAPRRHAEVRREPAEALPGHLQRQLRVGGLAGALAGAARRRPALGRARDHGLPRRQPAHEALGVLGVADRGGAPGPSGGDLPRRGVHAPVDDDDAREARVRAELHVLHLEEHEGRARRVRRAAALVVGVLPAERVRQHARHPARVSPARRPARVRGAAGAGRDALAVATASTPASSRSRTRPSRAAPRSTWTPRSTR